MPRPRRPKGPKPKQQPRLPSTAENLGSSILARCPVELLIEIAHGHLTQQDQCQLSRVCRDLHSVLNRGLYIDDAKGDYKALWYACETDNVKLFTAISSLLGLNRKKLRLLVNRPFLRDHVGPERRHLVFRLSKELTPLVVAIRAGSYRMVERLLAKGANAKQPDLNPLPGRSHCRLPVHWAAMLTCEYRPYDIRMILGSLLRHGANLHARPVRSNGKEGGSQEGAPLVQAISLRYFGTGPNGPTTAQMYNDDLRRALRSRLRMLELLLECPPKTAAARSQLLQLVSKLLQNFSRWKAAFYFNSELATEDERGEQKTLVHKHVLNVLQVLLEQPDIAKNIRVNPEPLYYACIGDPECQDDVASLLLANRSAVGDIALWGMCSNRGSSTKLFERLLNHETTTARDVDAQDPDGTTMLHSLCSPPEDKWQLDMAKLLIAKGANLHMKDVNGKTPFQKAKDMGMKELAGLLRNAFRAQASPRDGNKQQTRSPPREALAPEDKNKKAHSSEKKQKNSPKKKERQLGKQTKAIEAGMASDEDSCHWLVETW